MKGVEMLSLLQRKPANIRNICILAHVDHGKTTLSDALVASNGIISQRMAGKLRYLDSREDEQVRGITMKSSAISVFFNKDKEEYLINLIDSPGHVDFASEVSTAVRLCEGAVVVVDVVEGVCPQTHAVLRQAYLENIRPILVLNKLDRLITELKMEPMEAFFHLQQILVQVNLVTNELFTAETIEKTSNQIDGDTDELISSESQSYMYSEDDSGEERNIFFSPDQGNVIFASAYDGWGFTINHFAQLYSSKLGINMDVLQKTLWGDFYLNTKTKRIMKGAQSKGKKPLFVQFVLENIWSVYDAVYVKKDKAMMEKIIKSLGLTISPRDMRHGDPRIQLQAVLTQWLPVSRAVLGVVIDKLPSPLEMSEERVEKLMCTQTQRFDSLPKETQDLKKYFLNCSASEDAPAIIFVSKMFPVEKKVLPQNRQRTLTEAEMQERRQRARERKKQMEEAATSGSTETLESNVQEKAEGDDNKDKEDEDDLDHVFVGFARVFSGTVRKGQKLYVLGPKHDPAKALQMVTGGLNFDEKKRVQDLETDQHVTSFTVKDLYLFMGRDLELMESIPAGNILGIAGLEDHILKSGTVSSSLACPAFCDLNFGATPIVRVALEPKHAGDMKKLVQGLKLLNQADPCVQVLVQETGELVIITAGEVHLQRCIDDLKQRYTKIDIMVSDPIVPFRETIIPPPKVDMVNEVIQDQNQPIKSARLKEFEDDDEVLDVGLIEMHTLNKRCCIRIRALPLPEPVTLLLEDNQALIKVLNELSSIKISDKLATSSNPRINQTALDSLQAFKESLTNAFKNAGKGWNNAVDQIWSFGPRRVGPNLLLNRIEEYGRPSVWSGLDKNLQCSSGAKRHFDNSIVSGFQIATLAGPLCEEPMRGVCFVMEKWNYIRSSESISYETEVADSQIKKENSESIPLSAESSNRFECSEEPVVRNVEESTDLHEKEIDDISNGLSKSNIEIKKVDGQEEEAVNGNESDDDDDDDDDDSDNSSEKSQCDGIVNNFMKKIERKSQAPMSGQLIYCVKEGCRKAFQTQSQRLAVAMYKCNIQATTEALGKLCAVLGKRNGRILQDDMKEGSQMFDIVATIPVVESFGFAESMRKKTSGLASPQLVFSHWEVMDVDPFWVPTTEEEYMHFGEKADSANLARTYMNNVRKRKGLKVDEKIVEHAEKQRTLTKMK